MFSLVWIMPPRVMTRSIGWPVIESQGGGTGLQVGRGGRGRRPREDRMGTPTQYEYDIIVECVRLPSFVWSCPKFSAPAGEVKEE
ncbi:hypothetical protein Tco_0214597 [Tanacetum coccineum]